MTLCGGSHPALGPAPPPHGLVTVVSAGGGHKLRPRWLARARRTSLPCHSRHTHSLLCLPYPSGGNNSGFKLEPLLKSNREGGAIQHCSSSSSSSGLVRRSEALLSSQAACLLQSVRVCVQRSQATQQGPCLDKGSSGRLL